MSNDFAARKRQRNRGRRYGQSTALYFNDTAEVFRTESSTQPIMVDALAGKAEIYINTPQQLDCSMENNSIRISIVHIDCEEWIGCIYNEQPVPRLQTACAVESHDCG